MNSSVAICIPTFNQAAYLESCVRSALGQTHPCEVWVSDDASTDETPALMARLAQEFPRIHSIRQQVNLGISGNPTWLMKQPDTQYIIRVDSDDVLTPDFAAKLIQIMDLHERAGYGHAAVNEIDAAGSFRKIRQLSRRTGFQEADDSLRALLSGYRVAANICIYRRAALWDVGFYRTNLPFAEDWDLAVRLADKGWGNTYVGEVLASYRVWDTSSNSRAKRKLAELAGCRSVFDESFSQAFRTRNLPLAALTKARQCLALAQADSLRDPWHTDAEKNAIREALLRLGDSRRLRWKMMAMQTPLDRLIQIPTLVQRKAKSLTKALLFRISP